MQNFKIHCRCQKTRKNGKAIVKIPDAKRQNEKKTGNSNPLAFMEKVFV